MSTQLRFGAGWSVVLAAALALGCGPADLAEQAGMGQRQDEIRGGTVDEGDPNVFMIAMDYADGAGFLCTSTLIGRRMLLTAAHCVDLVDGRGPTRIRATNQTVAPKWTDTAGWLETSAYTIHEAWKPHQLESTADVAIVQLKVAPPIKAKPWNTTAIENRIGAELRAVGYGITSQGGTGSGTKRQVTMTIRGIDPNNLMTGSKSDLAGICSGDSGGPSFHTFDDGVERQIGIHSYGGSEGGCADGTDVRTDYYKSWISARLAEFDADCAADNVCKDGCMPADPDCLCGTDGSCNPMCADKSIDADCQEACADNGVCGVACTTQDPDCSAPYKGCDSLLDCASRLCVEDPQSPGLYCSTACTGSGECPEGFECTENVCKRLQLPVAQPGEPCTLGETYCADGTVCTGPAGQATSCQVRCFSPLGCAGTCESGQNGFKYCTPLLGEQNQPDPEPKGCGCAASSLVPSGLFALVLLGFRRRRSPAD